MSPIALIIYSKLVDAGESAIYRAMMFAQELIRAGDDVAIVFDGAGSTALSEMLDPSHELHPHLLRVLPQVRGACYACAKAYGVVERIQASGVPLLRDDRGHASLRALLVEGRQLVTF